MRTTLTVTVQQLNIQHAYAYSLRVSSGFSFCCQNRFHVLTVSYALNNWKCSEHDNDAIAFWYENHGSVHTAQLDFRQLPDSRPLCQLFFSYMQGGWLA